MSIDVTNIMDINDVTLTFLQKVMKQLNLSINQGPIPVALLILSVSLIASNLL